MPRDFQPRARTLTLRVGIISALAILTAACGGSGSSEVESTTATVAVAESALTSTALCEDWLKADGQTQRNFVTSHPVGSSKSVSQAITLLGRACNDATKARTMEEAIEEVVAADLQEAADAARDPYEATRIAGAFAKAVSKDVRKSWNRCDENDVCIAGEWSHGVGCSQPDLGVRKLRCFVTTKRLENGQGYGYPVAVAVASDGSYSWQIARGD